MEALDDHRDESRGRTAADLRSVSVSVLIPVFNEADRISACLDAVMAQDWHGPLQIVVVDSGSSDDTTGIASRILASAPGSAWSVTANPGGSRAANLNRALALSGGDIIVRVDARTRIPPNYISAVAEHLADHSIGVIGGSQAPVTSSPNTAWSRGAVRALRNPLGMGGARYRRGGSAGFTDTVYLGAFRRSDLERAGGWNERLIGNEDYDLNQRIGRVWFDPELEVPYTPRARARSLLFQYFRFGRWKIQSLVERDEPPKARQLAGLAVLPTAGLGLALLAFSRQRSRALILIGLASSGIALDRAATDPASPLERAAAVGLGVSIAVSWSAGAWTELVRQRLRTSVRC